MFKKQKQHLRILKKLKSLRRAKNAYPKGSEERKASEHAYLHLRDRYLDTVMGSHDKGQASNGAAKRYRRKFKHIGWGFVLRQVGMGMVMGIIRRPLQMIVPSILAFVGVKYFEPKLSPSPRCPHDPIEMQEVKAQTRAIQNKIEQIEAQIEFLKGLVMSSSSHTLLTNDNKSQRGHLPAGENQSSSVMIKDELGAKTASQQPHTQEKFAPQQIKKGNSFDKKDMEFKPVNPGITRVGTNRFVYKFNSRQGRMS